MSKQHVGHGDFFIYQTAMETYFCLVAEEDHHNSVIVWLGRSSTLADMDELDALQCPFTNGSDADFINNLIDDEDASPRITIVDIHSDKFFKSVINELTK